MGQPMDDVLVRVDGIGKKYHIRHQQPERYNALRDVIADRFRAIFRSDRRREAEPPAVEDFWALKDVSFEVKHGEVLGIIGRNGAGKSTLLRILSRITEPTEGRVELNGRVASLLEVGTGFHPELTGRENIYLNGSILGMTRAEIKSKFSEIVAFAEVEKFLDTPVKRFSSGMHVRLAFAVAAHLEPEILIVDEVLAVGDAEFQTRCLGKMSEVAAGGRTVLFVSHNMTAVQALCGSAVLLEGGKLLGRGPVEEVLRQYMAFARPSASASRLPVCAIGRELTVRQFMLTPEMPASGASLVVDLKLVCDAPTRVIELCLLFFTHTGQRIAVADVRGQSLPIGLTPGDEFSLEVTFPCLPFVEGEYTLGLYLRTERYSKDLRDLAVLTVMPRTESTQHTPYPAQHRGFLELEFVPVFCVTRNRR